ALFPLFTRRRRLRTFLLAGAVMVKLHPDALALAVIGVGFAVAAANRPGYAHAEGGCLFAFTRRIRDAALARGFPAPQRRIAGDSVLAAARFVEIRRRGANRSERRTAYDDENRNSEASEMRSHGFLQRQIYAAAPFLFCRFLTRSSTTAGSASVEVSPRLPGSSSAILRRMRRMILPERVFGRPGANWIWSGEAIGPMSLRTHA